MRNCFEISGSVTTFIGAAWLLIDALRIRGHIRSESGASELLRILNKAGASNAITDEKGNPLNSDKDLQLWFAARTITWNWIALGLMAGGFLLDFIGKLRP